MSGVSGSRGPQGRFGSELAARVASAAVLVPLALVATWIGGLPFRLLWLAAAIAVLHEWLSVAKVGPRAVLFATGAGTFAIVALASPLGAPLQVAPLAGLVGFSLLVAFASGSRNRLWAAGGFLCAGVILLVPPAVRDDPLLGVAGIIWMFAVVWGSDTAAYFTGRSLGGPKLMPKVSPKKTWSGFLGGLVAATLLGLAVASFLPDGRRESLPLSMGALALLSALAAVLGQAGDLAESAMKRHFGVKDSSHLIPGHGGVMDRLDAFFAVACLVGLLLGGATLLKG